MDDKATMDEARRVAQHASVKAQIEGNVNAEIKEKARTVAAVQQSSQVVEVAEELRGRAISETLKTEHEAERARGAARISQFVDFAFYLLYALLTTRLMLALIAARSDTGFVRFIKGVTDPFYAPFRGIVPSPTVEGGFTLAIPIAIALVAYMVLHVIVHHMFRLAVERKTTV
jgi:uncharacterized protein YggT (Ycf19 family)